MPRTHDLSHGPLTWVQIPASPKNSLGGRKITKIKMGQVTPKIIVKWIIRSR